MRDYTLGDAIRFKVTFRDENDALFDPSSTWGTVYDSSSTVVSSISALTKADVGVYTATWQSSRGGAIGQGAFEACGVSGANVFVRREILFRMY